MRNTGYRKCIISYAMMMLRLTDITEYKLNLILLAALQWAKTRQWSYWLSSRFNEVEGEFNHRMYLSFMQFIKK